jgi:branched-chain amino acid aminotransferase
VRQFDRETLAEMLDGMHRPYQDGYYAMFSTHFGGIVTDPVLMTVPVDDHLVHRGDGVFETMKCVRGGIYNMQAHLERLVDSARSLELEMPMDPDGVREVVTQTVRAGGRHDCLIRLIVSRGPGSLGVDPYDCPQAQVYVVVSRLRPPFMRSHPRGARAGTSSFPVKQPFFATMKNCNYLPNVLMRKEAVDRGLDFVVAFDDSGLLAEGATENVGVVTKGNVLRFPGLDGVLRGTTMMRVAELAAPLVPGGDLAAVDFGNIGREDVLCASEFLVLGTTRDVTAVTEFDGRQVGCGRPGPVYRKLAGLLLEDIQRNLRMRTEVFAD